MNKFYVTKDVAEKLRAKGYYREYDVTDEWVEGIFYQVEDGTFHLPRIDEVLDWLREEKKIYLELVIVVDAEYMCDIYKIDASPIECLGSTEYSKTYEAAAIAGIEYCLDNLI